MTTAPLLPAPAELRLVTVRVEPNRIVVVAATCRAAACPRCGTASRRVHSWYARTPADLPWQGTAVQLELHTRKVFCETPSCPQHIFTERLPATARPSARRTQRLHALLAELAVRTGGAPGARLATLLGMPVSAPTLLRTVRRLPDPPADAAPRIVGIDDWCWRRGRTYRAIVVDLERHCVLDLLPDRSAATAADWFAQHPTIEVISRDRGGEFAEAARQGAPRAVQVADRFHLLCNLTDAVAHVLGRHDRALRAAAPRLMPAPTEPEPPSAPDRPLVAEQARSAASRTRRLSAYEEVRVLREQGATLGTIARTTGRSRRTIQRWLQAGGFPERANHRRRADWVAAYFCQRWAEGCHNATQLWRELRVQGSRGSLRTIQCEIALQHLARDGAAAPRPRAPSPRQAAWLLLRDEAEGTDEERAYVAALTAEVPAVAELQQHGREFIRLVRDHDLGAFDAWLVATRAGELHRFAQSLQADEAAVRAAIALEWSNGQTEGQITKVKLTKRSMFGRAKLDLLRQRVLHAA